MQKEPLIGRGGEDMSSHHPENVELDAISPENCEITNIPFQILKSIFEEANKISTTVNGIVEMPGCEDKSSLLVLNVLQQKDPYRVCKLTTSNYFTCEKRCHRFSCFKMCSHTIAAAEHCNLLKSYVQLYNQKHKTLGTCLTKMALANMPKNRGQKPKGTSVRKGKHNKISTIVNDFETAPQQSPLQQPFHLTFLAGIVKKCYGCGQCFSEKQRSPPYDLILKRFDHRIYLSPNSKTFKTTPTLQNTYYHLNSDCCRRHCPLFEISRDVIIHREIKSQLSKGHKDVLRKLNMLL
jgi:hypothetical protein